MRNCWHRRDRKKSIGKGDRTGREMFGESAAGGRGYKYIQRADRDKQTRICMQPLGERRLLVPALLPGIGVFFLGEAARRAGTGTDGLRSSDPCERYSVDQPRSLHPPSSYIDDGPSSLVILLLAPRGVSFPPLLASQLLHLTHLRTWRWGWGSHSLLALHPLARSPF